MVGARASCSRANGRSQAGRSPRTSLFHGGRVDSPAVEPALGDELRDGGREHRSVLPAVVLRVVVPDVQRLADAVHSEHRGQQQIEIGAGTEAVGQQDGLAVALDLVHLLEPAAHDTLGDRRIDLRRAQHCGHELPLVRPGVAGRDPAGEPDAEVTQPRQLPGAGDLEEAACGDAAPAIAHVTAAEQRRRPGGGRQAGDRDQGVPVGRVVLGLPPVVGAHRLDPGLELLGEGQAFVLGGPEEQAGQLADLAGPGETVEHTPFQAHATASALSGSAGSPARIMRAASACLHGPRSPRCLAHHGHVQENPPSAWRT